MKKKKKSRSRGAYTTGILFAVAVLLLLGSVAGSSQAALTYYSENYSAELRMYDIGVTLVENGQDVSWRNYAQRDDKWYEGGVGLLSNMLYTGKNGEQEELQLNTNYAEALCVKNSGNIDEYVRVIIYRYWVDAEKEADGTPVSLEKRRKRVDISPEFIKLAPWNGTEEGPDSKAPVSSYNGWVLDADASTTERIILYYTSVLGTGEKTPDFADSLWISKDIKEALVSTDENGNILKDMDGKYIYQNEEFVLEIEADAVQTHNAEDAIMSAWGVDVAVNADGNISLRR